MRINARLLAATLALSLTCLSTLVDAAALSRPRDKFQRVRVTHELVLDSTATFTALPGVQLGTGGQTIADSFAASAVIDFAATTNTTADSAAITVTGAALGDTCTVGTALAATWAAGATFDCYVSAANQVKVRLTAIGTAIDPASDTFHVRVFDP